MSNFGFEHLRVVNPYNIAFREARSALGAAKLLASAEEFKSVADAVADCILVVGTSAVTHREPQHQVYRLERGSSLMREALKTGKVACVRGKRFAGPRPADKNAIWD
jgi:tRNA C32,U32 (ribose-2'-O)-methylase TrmJ